MRRILLAAVVLVGITAYALHRTDQPELASNTEAYFQAHGIVQGQANELHIGGTLFRFPAGVGLNPYTAQTTIVSVDGSPMTLSSKDGLDQGKYKTVATPIAKGTADSVTFYLEPQQNYAPGANPFTGGVRVTVSKQGFYKWDGVNTNPDERLKELKTRKSIDHPALGLREYVAPNEQSGSYFESLKIEANSPSSYGQLFSCQPGMSGFCFRNYWVEDGQYSVEIAMNAQLFLQHWQEACPAVARFVKSVAVE